jgi:hypothetical protein
VRRTARLVSVVFPIVVLLAIASCRGPAQSYTSLGPHAFPHRHQFNRDGGRTRIVILPAPN